jgi:hypothetical protein
MYTEGITMEHNNANKVRVINLEDNVMKHHAITRVLEDMRIRDITWVKNVDDGMEEIEKAISNGIPYSIAITDMQFYLHKDDSNITVDAGEQFIKMVSEKGIELPIIVCSSDNLVIEGTIGTVWYQERRDWEADLRGIVGRQDATQTNSPKHIMQ